MLHFARVRERDRLEAPVRVLPDPELPLGRREVLRCAVVAHEERRQLLGEGQRAEARMHVKAIAHLEARSTERSVGVVAHG